MAEEFQGGICGGNWWATSSRHALVAASPCSVGFNDHMGMSFGCLNDLDMVDIKARTTSSGCGEIINNNTTISSVAVSVSDHHSSNNIGFDHQSHNTECASGSASNLIDSTLQMIGFGLSSSTSPSDFINQANLLISRSSGRGESNFHSMVNEDMGTKLNYEQETSRHDQIQKDWSPKSTFSGVVGADDDDKDSSIINGFKFKPMNQELSNFDRGSSNSSGFPISSSAMANSYGFSSSTLLQSLFESELVVPQTQQSLFNTHPMSYSSSADPNYGAPNNPNDLLLSPTTSSTSNWPRLYSPSSCLRPTSQLQPPKQQVPAGGSCGHGLHFSNNTPFWNASASTGLFPSASQSQYTAPAAFEHKPNSGHNFITKTNTNEHVQDSTSIVKKSGSSSSCEVPVFKRARIETPSPLPTFKVRKEKLGDRITALQQLVSPFGKTDTASVLHEAIEYIKFLHDQVSVLSTPYMKNGGLMQQQQQQQGITCDHNKMEAEGGGGKQQDLKSRGLCLVPISSTFPVANETTADFWTPTFGATFR